MELAGLYFITGNNKIIFSKPTGRGGIFIVIQDLKYSIYSFGVIEPILNNGILFMFTLKEEHKKDFIWNRTNQLKQLTK